MKKLIPFLIGFLIGMLHLNAAEMVQNDTTIRYKNKIILVQDSLDQVKVKVFYNDSTPYKQLFEGIYSDTKTYEKWTVIEEFGIQLPFLDKLTRHKKYKMEGHWAGIGWGFANITDAKYKLNDIDGLSLKSESSNEFFFNLIEKTLPLYKNNIGLTSGFGFNWKNYFLEKNAHLIENDDITIIAPAPAGINYKYSRLRVFQIAVPLLLEWQPTFGKNHKLFINAGVIGGVNAAATYRVKYTEPNGGEVNMVESKGLNIAPITLDYIGQIGYNDWSVYAKYSPFSIFQNEKGPNVRAVSLGVMLNF